MKFSMSGVLRRKVIEKLLFLPRFGAMRARSSREGEQAALDYDEVG